MSEAQFEEDHRSIHERTRNFTSGKNIPKKSFTCRISKAPSWPQSPAPCAAIRIDLAQPSACGHLPSDGLASSVQPAPDSGPTVQPDLRAHLPPGARQAHHARRSPAALLHQRGKSRRSASRALRAHSGDDVGATAEAALLWEARWSQCDLRQALSASNSKRQAHTDTQLLWRSTFQILALVQFSATFPILDTNLGPTSF